MVAYGDPQDSLNPIADYDSNQWPGESIGSDAIVWKWTLQAEEESR